MNSRDSKKYMSSGRLFSGNSRNGRRADGIMGLVHEPSGRIRKFRSANLHKVQKYLDGTQYDHLAAWRECQDDEYIPVRQRKPRVTFPFAKIFQNRLASKLVGGYTFPALRIEDDPDTEQFLSVISSATFFKAKMLTAAKNLISYTSAFARFKMVEGSVVIENYNPNYCYPEFDARGELIKVEIKYVFESDELDSGGNPIMKWFKLEVGQNADVLYDEPEYKADAEPVFNVVENAAHNLGMVQGQWFRAGEGLNGVDGEDEPIACQIAGFIDSLNYNLSQSDSAVGYGMEPQLTVQGMDEDEMNTLIKSSSRAWFMGREGEAKFNEVSGSGVTSAKEFREDLMKMASHASQIVFLDPEKMAANAQSGKAMEVMHASLVEAVNELRPWMEKGILSLAQKILAVIVHYQAQGFETDYVTPEGWRPASLDIKATWPPIFPLTIQDMQQVISTGLQMATGNILSRLSVAKWIMAQGVDLGVDDLELEQQLIDGQKQFNTFF